MKLIYVVLASFALVSAEISDILSVTETLKTVSIQKVLENMAPSISQFVVKQHLDPYALEPTETEFWVPFEGIPLISYKAHLNLFSGEFKGLSNLKFDDSTLTYEDRILTMAINMRFPLVKVSSNYNLKLRFLNPQGTITADVKAVYASIVISFNTTDYMLALNKFQLQSLDITNVIIQDQTGWKFWIFSGIANIVAAVNKDKITEEVQTSIAAVIRAQLDDFNNNTHPEVLIEFFQKLLGSELDY